jgi:hypothetical protein
MIVDAGALPLPRTAFFRHAFTNGRSPGNVNGG